MVADVAVVEEVARHLLAAAGAALVLQVEARPRSDRLRVQAGGVRVLRRELLEGRVGGKVFRLRIWIPPPAVGATVQMVDVEHLAAAVHQPGLAGLTEV